MVARLLELFRFKPVWIKTSLYIVDFLKSANFLAIFNSRFSFPPLTKVPEF